MKKHTRQTGLRLHVARNYQAMSRAAAAIIEAELESRPDLLFCASAGATPTGVYECLAARYALNPRLFREMRVLQIDEWAGLPDEHPASCRTDLQRKLTGPLAIDPGRFIGFRSEQNSARECSRIKRWLALNGPIDICILGLGLNGHVAMNEPADEFVPDVHVSTLSRSSLNHGMLRDLAKKPRFGLTLGLADILQSRKILLVVSGRAKQHILARLLAGRVSSRLPASFLYLHPDVTILCDRDSLPKRPNSI